MDASFYQFKDIINQLTNDVNPSVKLASFFALWPSYNIEREWASEQILELYENDYRFVGFHGTKDMMFLLYPNYRDRILKLIERCYYSEDKDLIRMGAAILTEMYLVKGEFMHQMTNVSEMSKEQVENILHMVIVYFNKDEFNSLAKDC